MVMPTWFKAADGERPCRKFEINLNLIFTDKYREK